MEQKLSKMLPMDVLLRHCGRSGRDGKLLLLQNLFDKRIQGETVKVFGEDGAVGAEEDCVRDAGDAV